jgi:integral membrane sensor domain MASE1
VSVDKPPKISEVPARSVPIEVLPPLPAPPAQSVQPKDGPPIHGLSALILVAVDSLWIPGEFLMPISLVAIPACFTAVFIPTYLIQRHLKNDSKGRALTFATILAVLAAIPTPVTGTPVGFALLAWTGLGKLLGRSPSK